MQEHDLVRGEVVESDDWVANRIEKQGASRGSVVVSAHCHGEGVAGGTRGIPSVQQVEEQGFAAACAFRFIADDGIACGIEGERRAGTQIAQVVGRHHCISRGAVDISAVKIAQLEAMEQAADIGEHRSSGGI